MLRSPSTFQALFPSQCVVARVFLDRPAVLWTVDLDPASLVALVRSRLRPGFGLQAREAALHAVLGGASHEARAPRANPKRLVRVCGSDSSR